MIAATTLSHHALKSVKTPTKPKMIATVKPTWSELPLGKNLGSNPLDQIDHATNRTKKLHLLFREQFSLRRDRYRSYSPAVAEGRLIRQLHRSMQTSYWPLEPLTLNVLSNEISRCPTSRLTRRPLSGGRC
jgi:hypothetical protein